MAGFKNETPDEKFCDGYSGGGTQDRALEGTDQRLTKKPASLRKGVRRRKDSRILVDVDSGGRPTASADHRSPLS